MEKYNVYIIEQKGKAVECIGKGLSDRRSQARMMSALSRINDNFYVDDAEVGSADDRRYTEEVASLKSKL